MEYFSEGNGLVIWSALLLLGSIGTIAAFRFSKRKDFAGQAIIPTMMIAFSLLFLAVSFSFPTEEAGPALIPRLWVFWILLLCSMLLVFCMIGKVDKDPECGRIGFMAIGIVLTIAYFFAISIMGLFHQFFYLSCHTYVPVVVP